LEQKKQKAEEMARVMKALAHPERIFIMERLSEKEHTVGELAGLLAKSAPTVSKHLTVLRNAGLVSFRKEGLNAWYRTECKCITGFHACVADIVQGTLIRKRNIL